MLHAWRHASTAVAAQRAAASVAAHLPTGALLLAAPLPLLLPPSRGFASKSPIGRSGIARAENPWGTNKSSGNRAANAAPSQQQAQTTTQPPPPRQERNSSSDFGARNAWSSRSRDGGSNSAASGSGSSGGKKRYHPRTLGAAAAAANPRPAAARSSVTNPSGPAWAPVAAKFAEASAWTPAPQKAWSRGGGAKHSSQTAAPQTGAGAQSWARSAARRERSHGAPLPDLSAGPAPAQAQAPPAAGSHKRGSRPTAEGRSSYRHGGERDARSKMRERERYTPPTAPSAAFDPSSSADVSRVPRSPRSFPETADLEEDVMEDVEATKSAAEFWTHFPSVNNSATKKGAAAGTKPGEAPQVPQRLVPLPPEPEQYKPVFLNHPPPSSNASPGATSSAAAAPSRRAVPAPAAAKVRGSELSELMGTSVGSVSLNRSTLRLGVLLPDPAPQDLGFVDPEAPPPSEADRALEAFHDRVRQRIEGLCQQLATDTGADLTTHPLHVDMCAEFVPMDLADVTGGAAAALAAAPSSVSASSSSLPPDPLLVLQLFESSIRHAPNSHRGHLRIRADASTGQGSGVRGTALKGQGFFPSFVDYFKHAAARVHRDANEAKLMARSAMIRAVGWKPTQENAAVATEEPEEEEGEETEADAEHAEPVTESSEQSDATASSTTATPAASKPAAAAATTSKPPSRRLRLRNVSAQLPQPLAGLTVMDATAGFGVDAFALAMSGATVHAYESYPLFQTLLRQAFALIRRSPSAAEAAVAAEASSAPAPQASDGRLQFVLDRIHLHEADTLQAMRGLTNGAAAPADASALPSPATASAVSMPRPDVVYLDLYPPSSTLSPSSLPFRISIRQRYLRLLCGRPTPGEVDQMLEAALHAARSHVVMRFPSKGEHYRPGDAMPDGSTQAASAHPAAWEVARIFKHKHMQSDFVVYRKKSG